MGQKLSLLENDRRKTEITGRQHDEEVNMEKCAIESAMPAARHISFGSINRFSNHLGAALCAAALIGPGIANATLVGDTVTVGHYAPNTSTPLGSDTSPSTFAVQTGIADLYTFYNSYPYGYQVNVEANSILLDFNYLNGATTTWEDRLTVPSSTCLEYSGFFCILYGPDTTVLYDFNGLIVSDLDDSSGNPLQSVTVSTNMVGWDSSRLSFGGDYVQFDWKGLTTNSDLYEWNGVVNVLTKPATYFNATLDFGGTVAAVPEPETYAMMLAGLGLLGLVRRRKQKLTA